MSLYDDLGVPADANSAEIAAAYRRAAKKHHPDAGGDAAEFNKVCRAGLVLRDPEKRARYDRDGSIDDEPDRTGSLAMEVLVDCFNRAIEGETRIAEVDILERTRAEIISRRDQCGMMMEAGKAALEQSKDVLRRLQHAGGGYRRAA